MNFGENSEVAPADVTASALQLAFGKLADAHFPLARTASSWLREVRV